MKESLKLVPVSNVVMENCHCARETPKYGKYWQYTVLSTAKLIHSAVDTWPDTHQY